jgi:hypothetical protein
LSSLLFWGFLNVKYKLCKILTSKKKISGLKLPPFVEALWRNLKLNLRLKIKEEDEHLCLQCISNIVIHRLNVLWYSHTYYIKSKCRSKHILRIRVRIDPPHLLVCRKRRLRGAVLRMRPEKPRPCVTSGVAR